MCFSGTLLTAGQPLVPLLKFSGDKLAGRSAGRQVPGVTSEAALRCESQVSKPRRTLKPGHQYLSLPVPGDLHVQLSGVSS